MLIGIFSAPPSNVNIESEQKTWTLPVLVEAIRTYPDSAKLITMSRAKDGLRPDTVKRIVFGLVASGIVQLNYHVIVKKAVFSLARSGQGLAMSIDSLWDRFDLK